MNYSPTSLSFNINWKIKNDPVYRIFDDIKWMENFFETGEIMLSCFANFKKNTDEMQGDKSEGSGIVGGLSKDGKSHEYVFYNSGTNAYIMSATSELDKRVINDFKGKCAIKINFPTLFGLEISKKLPFVKSGLEGKCDYKPYRSNIYGKEQIENDIFQSLDFQKKPYNYNQKVIEELTRGREIFLKEDKYQHQKEYRFAWFSDKEISKSIIVNCPEAIEYCDKIYF